MVTAAFLVATLSLFFSGVPGLLLPRGSVAGERLALAMVVGGSTLGLAAAVGVVLAPAPLLFSYPWGVPGGNFALCLDTIAALFLLPVYVIALLGAVYALGYWPERLNPGTGRRLRLFYGVIVAALTLVLTAASSLLFLVAWEIMALAGYFLITTEEKKEEARRAGFLYLVATHTGTLALLAMFILLGEASGSLDFPYPGALAATGSAAGIFLLALFGFGLKAGLIPLHVWLPGAHAAAPSHVSALLSGVMIKTGIYGLVRLTGFFAEIPPWWGWTLLTLGAVSGVLGVAFAIAQHDLKRLLAYHSVENIGIIALGLGLALLGRSHGLPALALLGLAGALLHVVNHGLFKSLLFLGAGSVIQATGSRQIGGAGGLLRRLPVTGICFFGGAVAISGLPPLNGFISEWLVYLGALHSLHGERALSLAAVVAPTLALIGALALACFVKVFGALFLGAARSAQAAEAREAPASMRWPMLLLLAACAGIGLFPASVFPLLERAAQNWGVEAAGGLLAVAPPWPLTFVAWLLLVLAALLWLWRRRARRQASAADTWGCGYALPNSRMQYTPSSFAALLVDLFRWGLRPERHGGRAEGVLPASASFASHTPDAILDRLLLPLVGGGARACTWLRARIQNGSGGLYLLYVALTLCSLLIFLLLRG
ncbi:MAG: hydrogenase [Desulfuromonadales bacterium]|nr:hydrogenase [Desulfuromonadales bacterium]